MDTGTLQPPVMAKLNTVTAALKSEPTPATQEFPSSLPSKLIPGLMSLSFSVWMGTGEFKMAAGLSGEQRMQASILLNEFFNLTYPQYLSNEKLKRIVAYLEPFVQAHKYYGASVEYY